MAYILGISAYYHDSSVCLFRNGQLIFACEEEKFTGVKHDSSFPIKTLEYIFKTYRLNKNNVEAVCYYEDPKIKLERVIKTIKPIIFKSPLFALKSYFGIKKNISELNELLPGYSNKVFYSTHHEAHLYYSFYTSNFEHATCLSIDGVGEFDTMSLGVANRNGIDYFSLAKYPHSIGLFYSAMTSFLGFKPNEGEYKVMGLASYGDPKIYIDKVRELIKYEDGVLKCNLKVFCWDKGDRIMFNDKLSELLSMEPRLPEESIEPCHMDLAASIQKRYEEILFDVLDTVNGVDASTNLCLGGGCAYNGTANGKIVDKTHIKHLWIPPAPSDAGSAIGACVHYLVKHGALKQRVDKSPFLGPEFYNDQIVKAIKGHKHFKFSSDDALVRNIAKKLKDGKVIGWFQDRIEFGSRALGNRSILADPTNPDMKDRINRVIKKREGFRPFAPMVIKEKQEQFFQVTEDIPYMNQIVQVKPEYRNKLLAVTHVDGSARMQTVYRNSLVHELLLEFEKLSGYPILLNTSFNIKDKTMVLTPKDAIETFYDTEMDFLVIGRFLIYK
jgi:carbamoyltransferase